MDFHCYIFHNHRCYQTARPQDCSYIESVCKKFQFSLHSNTSHSFWSSPAFPSSDFYILPHQITGLIHSSNFQMKNFHPYLHHYTGEDLLFLPHQYYTFCKCVTFLPLPLVYICYNASSNERDPLFFLWYKVLHKHSISKVSVYLLPLVVTSLSICIPYQSYLVIFPLHFAHNIILHQF